MTYNEARIDNEIVMITQINKIQIPERYDVQAWNYIRRLGRRSTS